MRQASGAARSAGRQRRGGKAVSHMPRSRSEVEEAGRQAPGGAGQVAKKVQSHAVPSRNPGAGAGRCGIPGVR